MKDFEQSDWLGFFKRTSEKINENNKKYRLKKKTGFES